MSFSRGLLCLPRIGSGAVLKTGRGGQEQSAGPLRRCYYNLDRRRQWLDQSGTGQVGEKRLDSGHILEVEPTGFAEAEDRKEGGVKGNSVYFGLSKQNDGAAWWVGRSSALAT